jgi:hypothetical protein
MEKVQKPSNSVCYTPSSEPFRTDGVSSGIRTGRVPNKSVKRYRLNQVVLCLNGVQKYVSHEIFRTVRVKIILH